MAKKAFVVELNNEDGFQRLLPGMPETFGMKSGKVSLLPKQQCGEHSTKEREEMLVFLSGKGQAFIEGQAPLDVGAGKVLYVPPETLHDIKNTGEEPLVYIYCVAVASEE